MTRSDARAAEKFRLAPPQDEPDFLEVVHDCRENGKDCALSDDWSFCPWCGDEIPKALIGKRERANAGVESEELEAP